jgi:hypothetical protein
MDDEGKNLNVEENITFGFPILDSEATIQIANIPTSFFSNFQGMATKDHDTFIFNFDALYHSYDYSSHAQNIKLFPSTLKSVVLLYFMGFVGNTILIWDDMHKCFFF